MNKSRALVLANSLFTCSHVQSELHSLLDFAGSLPDKDDLRVELLHRLSHWAKLNKSRQLGVQTFKMLNEGGVRPSSEIAIKGSLRHQKTAILAFCNLCLYEQLHSELIAVLINSVRPYPYEADILKGLSQKKLQSGMKWLRGAQYSFFHKGVNFLIQQSFKLKLEWSKEVLSYFFQQFQHYKKDYQQLSSSLKLLYFFSAELTLVEHTRLLSCVLADEPFYSVHIVLSSKFQLSKQSHRLALLVYLSAVLERSPQLVKSQKLNQTVRCLRVELLTFQCQFFIKSSYNSIQRIKREKQTSVDTHILNELEIFLIGLLPGKWNNQQLSLLSCLYFSMKYYVQKADWQSFRLKVQACRSTLLNQHTYFSSSISDLTLMVCKQIEAQPELLAFYLPFFSIVQELSQSEIGPGIFKIIYYVATANKKARCLNELSSLVSRGLKLLLTRSSPAFDEKEAYDGLAKILFKLDFMCTCNVISQTTNYSLLDNLTLKLQQQLIGYIGSCVSKQAEMVLQSLIVSRNLSILISHSYKVLLGHVDSCLLKLRLLDFIELVAYQMGRFKETQSCPSESSQLQAEILDNLFRTVSESGFGKKAALQIYRNIYNGLPQASLLEFLMVSAKLLDYSYVEGQSRPFQDPLQEAVLCYLQSVKTLTAISERLEDCRLEVSSSQNLYMLIRVCSLLEVYAWIFQFPQLNWKVARLFKTKGLVWHPDQSAGFQHQRILEESGILPGAKISLLKRSIPRRQQPLLHKINLVPEKSKNRPAFLVRIKRLFKIDETCQEMLDKRARSDYEQHSYQLLKLFELCVQNQQISLIKHLHSEIAAFFLEKNDLLSYLKVVELVLPLGFVSDFVRIYSSFISLIENLFTEAQTNEFKEISKMLFSNRRSSCCRSSTLSEHISFRQGQSKLVSQLKRCLCVYWALSPLDVTFRKLQVYGALSTERHNFQLEPEVKPKQLMEQLKINISISRLSDLRFKFVQAFLVYKHLRQQPANEATLQNLQSLSEIIFNLVYKFRQMSLSFNRHMLELRQEVLDCIEFSLSKHACLGEPVSQLKQQDQFWLALELNQSHPRVKKSIDASVSQQNINQFKVSSAKRKVIPNVDSAFLCFSGQARFTLLKYDSSLKTFSVFRNVLNDFQAMDALHYFKEIIKSASRELAQKVTNKSLWWRKRQKNQKALSSALQRVKRHFRMLISLTEGCLNQQDTRLVKSIDNLIPHSPKRKRLRIKTIEIVSLLFKSQFCRPEFSKLLQYALANLPYFKFLDKEAQIIIQNLLVLPRSYLQTKRPLSLGLPACLHSFPWETVSERPVYRILIRQHTDLYKRVALENAFYEINPENNLNQITTNFEQFIYRKFPRWVGSFNQPIHEKDFETLQVEKNLFVYMGHGSGKHVPAVTSFLLGCCSSQVYNQFGQMNKNIARIVNRAGPSFMGCLWTVTSTDLDIFSKRLLELKGDLSTMIKQSRQEMRMRHLNGASIVVYGRPVIVQ